jgi:hypothetical protein
VRNMLHTCYSACRNGLQEWFAGTVAWTAAVPMCVGAAGRLRGFATQQLTGNECCTPQISCCLSVRQTQDMTANKCIDRDAS